MPQQEEPRPDLAQLQEALLLSPESGALAHCLERVHLADLGHWMQELRVDETWRIFDQLDGEERAELLEYAPENVRKELVDGMSRAALVEVVEAMPADEVVDLLALADDSTAEEVLKGVDFERARGLRRLADYADDTAGGLMTTEYPSVTLGARVGDAIKIFKKTDEEIVEDPAGTLVVDEHNRPVGYLSGHDLLTHGIHDVVDDVMATKLFPITPDVDQEEVAQTLLKYGLEILPVVDGTGTLLGVVSADDVLEVIAEEAQEDILKIVGTGAVEQTRLSVLARVRQRISLQLLTVAGGLATARILALAMPAAEGSDGNSALLRYLPIIIGLAGNVGIQTSTILVRGFATGEVPAERERAVLGSEVLTGLVIGILCGSASGVLAAWMEGQGGYDWVFGLAIGSAIAVAVAWAAFLGSVVPMVCRRTSIDPAVVAGPFLITMSDISGAAIFMGVAHAVLENGGVA